MALGIMLSCLPLQFIVFAEDKNAMTDLWEKFEKTKEEKVLQADGENFNYGIKGIYLCEPGEIPPNNVENLIKIKDNKIYTNKELELVIYTNINYEPNSNKHNREKISMECLGQNVNEYKSTILKNEYVNDNDNQNDNDEYNQNKERKKNDHFLRHWVSINRSETGALGNYDLNKNLKLYVDWGDENSREEVNLTTIFNDSNIDKNFTLSLSQIISDTSGPNIKATYTDDKENELPCFKMNEGENENKVSDIKKEVTFEVCNVNENNKKNIELSKIEIFNCLDVNKEDDLNEGKYYKKELGIFEPNNPDQCNDAKFSLSELEAGINYVMVRASDKLGNTTEQIYKFNVEKSPTFKVIKNEKFAFGNGELWWDLLKNEKVNSKETKNKETENENSTLEIEVTSENAIDKIAPETHYLEIYGKQYYMTSKEIVIKKSNEIAKALNASDEYQLPDYCESKDVLSSIELKNDETDAKRVFEILNESAKENALVYIEEVKNEEQNTDTDKVKQKISIRLGKILKESLYTANSTTVTIVKKSEEKPEEEKIFIREISCYQKMPEIKEAKINREYDNNPHENFESESKSVYYAKGRVKISATVESESIITVELCDGNGTPLIGQEMNIKKEHIGNNYYWTFDNQSGGTADVFHKTLKIVATDAFGRSYETKTREVMIEREAPAIKITREVNENSGDTENINADDKFTFSAKDPTVYSSGIKSIDVYLKNEPNRIYQIPPEALTSNDKTKEITLTIKGIFEKIFSNKIDKIEDGAYTLCAKAYDNAGNESIKGAEIKFKIDTSPPTIDKIGFSNNSYSNMLPTLISENVFNKYGYFFNEEVNMIVEVSDKLSGIKKFEYRLGSADPKEATPITSNEDGENISKTYHIPIPQNFKGQIYMYAIDGVDNRTDGDWVKTEEGIIFENAAPSINISYVSPSISTTRNGNPLYNNEVRLDVEITDENSGISEINYLVHTKNGDSNENIKINNEGHEVGQLIGDNWHIEAMDKNLVTKVKKTFFFKVDENQYDDITINVSATDNSENKIENVTKSFSIDRENPKIKVDFGGAAGNNDYYNGNRTAKITVTEHNFNANEDIIRITNSGAAVHQGIRFRNEPQNSDVYVAEVNLTNDGKYTFSTSCTDLAGNAASTAESQFCIDKTAPEVSGNFEQFKNGNENCFNSSKTMSLQIKERNFDKNLVQISVFSASAGSSVSVKPTNECTNAIVSFDSWSSSGDNHTISFDFNKDGVYYVTAKLTDLAGNTSAVIESPVFEIDVTAPKPMNGSKRFIVANKENSFDRTIEFEDDNSTKITYTVDSYILLKDDENNAYNLSFSASEPKSLDNNTLTNEDLGNLADGIYVVKAWAFDPAGNKSDEIVYTYLIQNPDRFNFLAYFPDSNKENQTGIYALKDKSSRAENINDIKILIYTPKNKTCEINFKHETLSDSDFQITSQDNLNINEIKCSEITIPRKFFTKNYGGTDEKVNGTLSVTCGDETLELVEIAIDNMEPRGSIAQMKWYDGFYGNADDVPIIISDIEDDINIDRCKITVTTDGNSKTLEASELKYDHDEHTITFTLGKGSHSLDIELCDKAGNIKMLKTDRDIYIGSWIGRWWIAVAGGSAAVLLLVFLIVRAIIKKKKASDIII